MKNFQSVADINVINENSQVYQDTIQRLKLRVDQLQDRLAMEDSKKDEDSFVQKEFVGGASTDPLNMTDTVQV